MSISSALILARKLLNQVILPDIWVGARVALGFGAYVIDVGTSGAVLLNDLRLLQASDTGAAFAAGHELGEGKRVRCVLGLVVLEQLFLYELV